MNLDVSPFHSNFRKHNMTFRRALNRLVLLMSLCFLASLPLFAAEGFTQDFDCFSVVVGKKASADGSVMFGHNEDVFAPVVNMYKVPGTRHAQGETVVLRNGGKVPQAAETPGYFWLNVPGWDVCDGYVNERNVAVGSDGCPSREETPELTDGGILFWLRRLVAERATTAREGVKLAGGLIDRFGYNSSGRSYVIADQDEAWVLAAVNGKHWVAQRVPDDQVAVIANCYTIQEIDLRDTANFLGSPDLVDYAVKRGWYDSSKDGKFNFAKAYSNPGSLAHPANIGRMWRGFDLLAGKKFDIKKQIPFAVVPKKKLTPQDLMRTLRDHYNGTELEDPTQAYICHDGTRYSMISHIRNWLPSQIKAVVWLAMHRPDLQTYSAWYPTIGSIPEAYATEDHETGLRKHLDTTLTPDKRERSRAYAQFVELDKKARADSMTGTRVKKGWKLFEQKAFRAQAEFEKKAARLLKRDPDKAVKILTDYTAQRAQEVYRKAGELLDSLK